MASPCICTAYRWAGPLGGVEWLFVFPTGQLTGGWAESEPAANGAIHALSKAGRCPLTVVIPKHPNEVEVARE